MAYSIFHWQMRLRWPEAFRNCHPTYNDTFTPEPWLFVLRSSRLRKTFHCLFCFVKTIPESITFVDAAQSPPCPCLRDAGECLIYESRPLSCRLEGVPMVDVHRGLFGDWCGLNFKEGIPETAIANLQLDYDLLDGFENAR